MPRPAALAVLLLLLCAAKRAPAQGKTGHPANQQKFFGKWKLDPAQSNLIHPEEADLALWRSYAPDGDRVKVAWGSGNDALGTYSARCDGNTEPAAGSSNIRCRQVSADIIEGEQLDATDSQHRYYRRVLSSGSKIMSIIWYADAKRRRQTERWVYIKD